MKDGIKWSDAASHSGVTADEERTRRFSEWHLLVGIRKGSGHKNCYQKPLRTRAVKTSCVGRPPHMLPPLQVDLWPFDLESGVRVTCDVGYLCANFIFPRPLCSRLRPDVRDRQMSDAHHHLMPPTYGQGIIMDMIQSTVWYRPLYHVLNPSACEWWGIWRNCETEYQSLWRSKTWCPTREASYGNRTQWNVVHGTLEVCQEGRWYWCRVLYL